MHKIYSGVVLAAGWTALRLLALQRVCAFLIALGDCAFLNKK